jgi:FtsP/CotA-like multicopper oxidase with cupredoxin domain
VDYTPLYYFVNGLSFSKDAPAASALQIPGVFSTGNVLLRFVNAGLRMHMPSVNGLSMSLIAEDGNVLPDVAIGASKTTQNLAVRVQSDVFLPAGKVYDVMVRPANNGNPAAVLPVPATAYAASNYQVFDRELSLSTNNRRDGGMQAILQVAGGALSTGALAGLNNDSYYCVPGLTLSVSDPSKGVIGNDVNVYGVTLTGNPVNHTLTPFGGGSLTTVPSPTRSLRPTRPAEVFSPIMRTVIRSAGRQR